MALYKCCYYLFIIKWMLLFCPIEVESSPFGDAGDGSDADVLDAVLE